MRDESGQRRARLHHSSFITHASSLLLLLLIALPLPVSADWQLARPGWKYHFPRNHSPHPEFKTEWWYFTGNVRDEKGRRFGYQLTFFRQGVRPPDQRGGTTSRFIADQFSFAHFTISDLAGRRFHFHEKHSRGAFGEAGFDEEEAYLGHVRRLAWIDDWKIRLTDNDVFLLSAAAGGQRIELRVSNGDVPYAIHGGDGISRKAAGEGRASHYYSGTRMFTHGAIAVGGRKFEVTGRSWFDHEWATNQLAPEQVGWDWFSIQLDDDTELMLYRMRLRDGTADPVSSGTFITRDGATRHLTSADFALEPLDYWKSKATGARYPIAWRVRVPSLELELRIETPLENQELVISPLSYWEGAIDAVGTRDGKALRGQGYMELTGYAGPLPGLSQ